MPFAIATPATSPDQNQQPTAAKSGSMLPGAAPLDGKAMNLDAYLNITDE